MCSAGFQPRCELYQPHKEWAYANSQDALAAFTTYAEEIGLEADRFKQSLSSSEISSAAANVL